MRIKAFYNSVSRNCWITWEEHQRNRSLAPLLGAELYEFGENKKGVGRYLTCALATLYLFRKTRCGAIIFVQNPSLLLGVMAVFCGRFLGRTVVVDSHNIGIIFEHRNRIVRWLGQSANNLVMKLAAITIVTNEELSPIVRQSGGRAFILPDPLPELYPKNKKLLAGKFNVIVVCTFANDEPYSVIFEAAKRLPRNTFIYFTGNYQKICIPLELSENIIFTGYLKRQDYIDYLDSSNVVIDLTLRESCLVCGAYEGMALRKPLILSDTPALRGYFGEGATYTKNTPDAIAEAIQSVTGNLERAIALALKRREEIIRDYPEKVRNLGDLLSQSSTVTTTEHG